MSKTQSQEELEHKLRSPYRPFPLGAKKALRDHAEKIEYKDNQTVCLDRLPPDTVLNEWELERIRTEDPEEIWDANGKEVKIYADAVIQKGQGELSLDPKDAKQAAREQSHFTRIE